MDLVFNLNGSVTYLDVSIVAPFSCKPSLVAAASTRPRHMAKRAEKSKFDRYPHINLVPFILETTGRLGQHARKFISNHMKDADNPPLAIRDSWSAIQNVFHSAISKQQLTAAVTRFFLGCVFSKDPSLRTVPIPLQGDASGAPLPQPSDIATINSLSSTSSNSGPIPVPQTRRDCTPTPPPSWEFHTTSLQKQRPRAVLCPMVPFSPRQVRSLYLGFRPPHSPMSVPPKWDHIPFSSTPLGALAGTHLEPPVPRPVLVVDHSQSPRLLSYRWYLHNADIDLITFSVSRCFSGTHAQHAGTTQIIAAICGRFHAVILQEASVHVPQVSDQFIAYTGDTDLAILLNRGTFEPNVAVFAFHESSLSRDTWSMVVFVVRGLLRRPSLSGTRLALFTFTMSWQKNAMLPLICSDGYTHA